MKIAIPKESHSGERRVAATDDTVRRLLKDGFEVLVERGAGDGATVPDAAYESAGARIVDDKRALYAEADIVLKVRAPGAYAGGHEADLLHEGQVLVSFVWPTQNPELVERLAARKVTVLAMDAVPRISRAQKLDALSTMANIAGYRAVIEAATQFGRFFTGQITAAGKVPPAKVLVIGAGVAGLAAIGAANSLGAIVRAFDTRPEVKEEVQSMGADFLELSFEEEAAGEGGYAKVMSAAFIEAEMALFKQQASEVDIIITTALIPGKPAPLLLSRETVEAMRPGSVIVDLAAETGGNCQLTRCGEIVRTAGGVSIIGYADLPSRMAPLSSQLYGTNLVHLMAEMGSAPGFKIDLENEVIRGMLVLDKGVLMWPPPKLPPPSPPAVKTKAAPVLHPGLQRNPHTAAIAAAVAAAALFGLGLVAPPDFLGHFTVFVLACFVGWQVVWNVKPALHTPLMSVTNAISGIILVGGMLQISGPTNSAATLLAALAVLVATINIAGGFLVTQRMLKMFQK